MNHKLKILTVFLFFISNVSSAQWQSPIKYERYRFYPFIQMGGIPTYIAAGFEYERKESPFGIQINLPFVYGKSKSMPSDYFPFSGTKSGIIGSSRNPLMDYSYSPTVFATYQFLLLNKLHLKIGAGINTTIYNKAIFYPLYYTSSSFSFGGGSSPLILYSIDHKKIYSPGISFFARVRPFQKRFRSLNIFTQVNINRHWTYGTVGLQLNIRKFKNDKI